MLWRVRRGGGRRHPLASRSSIANRDRAPRGLCFLQYTVAGQLQVRRGARTCLVPAGFAAPMWYGEASTYGPVQTNEAYESRWLAIEGPGLLDHWSALIARCDGLIGPDRSGRIRAAIDTLCDAPAPRDEPARIAHASQVQRFVMDLFQASVGEGPEVELALAAITVDPYGCGSVTEVATRHRCSREHLSRRFAQIHGVPPQRWLAEMRLARARELMRSGAPPLVEVARSCGWKSARGLAHALARHRIRGGRAQT